MTEGLPPPRRRTFLDWIEWAGNKLPDPVILFIFVLLLTWTGTGIGSLVSLMVPYSICFLLGWTVLLIVWWQLGMPLGLQASYTYP